MLAVKDAPAIIEMPSLPVEVMVVAVPIAVVAEGREEAFGPSIGP